ncbi:MAG: sigma 54-interacting transcriptional regulator [Deltaproteobacteria bacterium]|nr:sigma 54-interacting transcriptional regulator [Deltaproteobacteria bacterium]
MGDDFDLDDGTSNGTLSLPTSVEVPARAEASSLLFYHRDGSQLVSISEGESLVVGRGRPSDVVIHDPSLSRQHARFTLVDGQLWVEDLQSTNGTRIAAKRIKSRQRVRETDELQLGAVTGVFHSLAPANESFHGLESYDRLLEVLEQELVRGRTFSRPLALVMVRARKRKAGQLAHWAPRVRGMLRDVDRAAVYDHSSLLIGLVESGVEHARQLAEILVGTEKGETPLFCGIACYPDQGPNLDHLVEAVRSASNRATARQPVQLAGTPGETSVEPSGKPVIASPAMLELHETAKRVAKAAIPILITGETGTGKEVIAQVVHTTSERRKKSFRCINCASIPEQLLESVLFGHERGAFTGAVERARGVFEEASGGTVLLDEIGELSAAAQASLLRVLETKRVARVGSSREFEIDVRILASTHRDLEAMVIEGSFRQDLLFRLNTMVLDVPPLRARKEEIVPLAESFMRVAAKANRCLVRELAPETRAALLDHPWPGNVRELRNAIERAVVIAQDPIIKLEDLPRSVRKGSGETRQNGVPGVHGVPDMDEALPVKEKLQRYEAQLLLEALEANAWNQTRTAESLDMPLRTLVHKMKIYGLKKRYEQG